MIHTDCGFSKALYFMYLKVLFQNIFVNKGTSEATNFFIVENTFPFYISDFSSKDKVVQ